VSKPYYDEDGITIYHGDCREILPQLDKVDLVLTDPPYGIGAAGVVGGDNCGKVKRTDDKWDDKPISQGVLMDCIDMGNYSCVFGGNYYVMPAAPCWLIWDKERTGNFADAEMAWTNYGCAVRLKRHRWNGMIRKGNEHRDHPTQKPLEIMEWCITLCPNNPQTILDHFMGSGTTLRAAKDLQRKCIGIEIEEKYCEIAAKRLSQSVLPLNFI